MPHPQAAPSGKHTTPVWIRKGKKRRAGPNPWEPVQPLLDIISSLFSVEVIIIDTEAVCVAGTGPYKNAIGLTAPPDTALAQSLRSGAQTMVVNPREDDACRDCSIKISCCDQANYTAPVEFTWGIVAAVQIVAFDAEQRMALLERAGNTFLLIRQCLELLCRTGQVRPPALSASAMGDSRLDSLVGTSSPMLYLKENIRKAAGATGPVLVSGESGTGKELVALAVHAYGAQRDGPFVPVNCGALPESLMESELFGYVPGAFSGAQSGGRQGLWEQADGGTIFLDEISELPPALQVKLLRTLEDGMVRRVGGEALIQVKARVIAATNKDLRELVRKGLFRQDLYYRLNVIPLSVPPLRERKEDIRALTTHFIAQHSEHVGSRLVVVDPALMRRFMDYHWPGNVRELKNFIEYGIHFTQDSTITWDVLASHFDQFSPPDAPPETAPEPLAKLQRVRRRVSAELAMAALERHGTGVEGKKAAARELGISLASLYRLLKSE